MIIVFDDIYIYIYIVIIIIITYLVSRELDNSTTYLGWRYLSNQIYYHACTFIYIYVYVYIYRESEREREREKERGRSTCV